MADQNRKRESSGDEMDLDRSKQGSSESQRGSSRGSSKEPSRRDLDEETGYGTGSRSDAIGDEDELTGETGGKH